MVHGFIKGAVLTEPVVELLDLAGQAELREVSRVQQHVTIRHLNGVCARVRVRDAHEPRVAWRLGGIVGQRIYPAKEREGERCRIT